MRGGLPDRDGVGTPHRILNGVIDYLYLSIHTYVLDIGGIRTKFVDKYRIPRSNNTREEIDEKYDFCPRCRKSKGRLERCPNCDFVELRT